LSHYIFTVTAGRTGTAWLATLIGRNLAIPTVHESVETDDFGVRMPNIRTLRTFNNNGMTPFVRRFWGRKFDSLGDIVRYAETNHTLAKCGLVEHLAENRPSDTAAFVCVRRNWVDQCVSYIARGDFANITVVWQWYLHPSYRHVLVDPARFRRAGAIGQLLWYTAEMEARQAYYEQLYGDRYSFIRCSLEDITSAEGAARLLRQLGWKEEQALILPPRINASDVPVDSTLRDEVRAAVDQIAFDPDAAAAAYIASGRRLADTEEPALAMSRAS
jgi:hypothetical protein